MSNNSLLSKITSFFNPKTELKEAKPSFAMPAMTWGENLIDKQLHPYYGVVSGVYYAQTGMPWLSADARKAVKTEWFWQPIRGQPRRVDTNELRKYANTIWIQSIVQTILNQISSVPWDIVPKEGKEYANVKSEIEKIKEFLETPNKNQESFNDIIRSWLKDVLEIDAGVIVKVFSIDSYDFEHLEPRSGAPLLKPFNCPECNAEGEGEDKKFRQKAKRVLKSITFATIEDYKKDLKLKDIPIKPDYDSVKQKMVEVTSANSPGDENVSCPFCNGTGQGRHLVEIYAQDGASFLKDSDRTGWTYGYWQYSYAIPAHPMWFNRDEIVYFMQTPRSMSVYGYSAVQSSLEVVKSLEYSVKHNMALFLDGAVPDGIVSVEDMSNEEMTRMKTSWENDIKGQPHKVAFVNKKTTFTPFAFANREMQFIESQKEAWNQVIANFNMTPADLGITRDVNRSTAGNQTEMTRRKAIRPLLKKIETMLNSQLLPEIGATSTIFQYIIDDPVEERQSAELSEIYLRNGLKTINEIRIGMGLTPVDWGNENPIEAKTQMQGFGGTNGGNSKRNDTTGRATEPKEQRPSSNEAARRDRNNKPSDITEKDYSYPFQSQVPFVSTIQNLSSSVPFALPKQGHVNTQEPYRELNTLCPGCGSQQMIEELPAPGSINADSIWHCQHCSRRFTSDELTEQNKIQEALHNRPDPLAPKVNQDIEGESEIVPRRVPETNAFTGRKKRARLEKSAKDLLIEEFSDFIGIVESNEQRFTFSQVTKFVEATEDGYLFRYSDGKYTYECFVSLEDISHYAMDEKDFVMRYVRTAIPAKEQKRKITVEV